jgi:hypothetical protein
VTDCFFVGHVRPPRPKLEELDHGYLPPYVRSETLSSLTRFETSALGGGRASQSVAEKTIKNEILGSFTQTPKITSFTSVHGEPIDASNLAELFRREQRARHPAQEGDSRSSAVLR